MLIFELEDLEDITDKIIFEENPSIFNDENIGDFLQTAIQLMDNFVTSNPEIISEQDFKDIVIDEITDLFYAQFEEEITSSIFGQDIEDDIDDMIENAYNLFIETFYPNKLEHNVPSDCSELNDTNLEVSYLDNIETKIQKLRDIPQPVQRTPEWYQFRWNLITASNAWKAFETPAAINQLIYEKCQPIKPAALEEETMSEVKMVNTNTPLHWGQKYEPLSVLLYEHTYNTKVEDFGCIQHPTYHFIGASPDGINVSKSSSRYGRMLEIKNVVSREINGIPKKEYFVQMQLQMEVCDLDECDFLETKFVEYPDAQTFYQDTKTKQDEVNECENPTISSTGKPKGIILHFHTKEGKPFYVYKPLYIISSDDIKLWEETEVEKYEGPEYNYLFMKFIYWKVEVFSCVLVLRNREWFKNHIGQLQNVWNIIEQERISGYEHRAPKRKKEQQPTLNSFFNSTQQGSSQGCLLKFTKITKMDGSNEPPNK